MSVARPILFNAAMIRALLAGTKTQTRRLVKPQPDWMPEVRSTRLSGPFIWPIGSPGQQCGVPITKLPYGIPGDLLWVREGWLVRRFEPCEPHERDWQELRAPTVRYLADGLEHQFIRNWAAEDAYRGAVEKGKPSIHMHRWASRLTLEITDVQVERLQDISEADAIAEGIYRSTPDDEDRAWFRDYHEEQTGEAPSQADVEQFNEGVWKAPGVRQGWGGTPAQRDQDQWFPNAPGAYGLLWKAINGPESWAANPWVWAVSFRVHRQNVDAFLNGRAA